MWSRAAASRSASRCRRHLLQRTTVLHTFTDAAIRPALCPTHFRATILLQYTNRKPRHGNRRVIFSERPVFTIIYYKLMNFGDTLRLKWRAISESINQSLELTAAVLCATKRRRDALEEGL